MAALGLTWYEFAQLTIALNWGDSNWHKNRNNANSQQFFLPFPLWDSKYSIVLVRKRWCQLLLIKSLYCCRSYARVRFRVVKATLLQPNITMKYMRVLRTLLRQVGASVSKNHAHTLCTKSQATRRDISQLEILTKSIVQRLWIASNSSIDGFFEILKLGNVWSGVSVFFENTCATYNIACGAEKKGEKN